MIDSLAISAILPCYNHADYIEERIKSVLRQSLTVSEIVFLDDASTDDSVSIARNLLSNAKCPVHYLLNSINSGSPFSQWNKGILAARGNFIWIAETDDSCHTDLLQTLWNATREGSSSMAWCQSTIIDTSGVHLFSAEEWHNHIYPGLFTDDFQMSGEKFTRRYLCARNLIHNASAVLFSREAYIKSGMAASNLRYSGDWLLWINLLRGRSMSFVSQNLNYFRSHDTTSRANPDSERLVTENLICMFTAIGHKSTDADYGSYARIQVGPGCLLSGFQNPQFCNYLHLSLRIRDIPALGRRFHSVGCPVNFSPCAIAIMILFAFCSTILSSLTARSSTLLLYFYKYKSFMHRYFCRIG